MTTPTPSSVSTAIAVTLATILAAKADTDVPTDAAKQVDVKSASVKAETAPSATREKFGVLANESRAFPGYNLINPSGKSTYLYDNEGRVVHSWTSEYSGIVAYLLDNGHLFRTAEATNRNQRF